MKEFLKILEKDIKRCEEALKANNYIDIVIAVEELLDKYKPSVDGIEIDIDRDRVWNYSKRDLENLRDRLVRYKNEHIAELMFNSIRHYLREGEDLLEGKKTEINRVVDEIEVIYHKEESRTEKWEKLRNYLVWVSKEDVKTGSKIIDIINVILQISE